MSASQKNYKVGIYVRLFRDDERQGESVSIENQETICQGVFLQIVTHSFSGSYGTLPAWGN